MLEPTNEAETIDFYLAAQDRLGWRIVHLQRAFPDAVIENAQGQILVVEFEYKSRNFHYHGHDPQGCDLVICWQHNWPAACLPVWALEDCIPLPDSAWIAIVGQQLNKLKQRIENLESMLYQEPEYIDVTKPFEVASTTYHLRQVEPPEAAAALDGLRL